MNQLTLIQRAKEGDSQAITDVLNHTLQSPDLIAKATLKAECLFVVFEGKATPEQEQSVSYTEKFVNQLELHSLVKQIKVMGRKKGATFPAWNQEVKLKQFEQEQQATNLKEKSWWDTISENVSEATTNFNNSVGEAINNSLASFSLPSSVTNIELDEEKIEDSGDSSDKTIELDNLKDLSEKELLAFYGALFAMAAADGSVDPEESALILQSVDMKAFSESTKRQLQSYLIKPPSLEECFKELPLWDDDLRWQLIFYLLEIAWVDDTLESGEKRAIRTLQQELGISNDQVKALNTFVCTFKKIGRGEISSDKIEKTKAGLIKTLRKHQVPIPDILAKNNLEEIKENQENYSEEDFWEKIRASGLVAGREVVEKALIFYYATQQSGLDIRFQALAIGALGYFISPIDAIPDLVPAAGYADDLAVLMTALPVIIKNVTPETIQKAQQQTEQWFGQRE